jgi:hypothetical protein
MGDLASNFSRFLYDPSIVNCESFEGESQAPDPFTSRSTQTFYLPESTRKVQ